MNNINKGANNTRNFLLHEHFLLQIRETEPQGSKWGRTISPTMIAHKANVDLKVHHIIANTSQFESVKFKNKWP